MPVITMPRNLRCGRGCKIEQVTTDSVSVSDPSGSTQARSYGVPRWSMSLVSPQALPEADAAVWKAMLLGLRGSVNYLAAYDPGRPVPLGTLRGALTLGAAVALGDSTAVLACGAGQAGKTIKVGDWLQIGVGLGSSQLVMCVADAAVDGAGNLALVFEPPARQAYASGVVVTWDRPVAYYRRLQGRFGFSVLSPRHAASMSVDLLEAW